MTARVGGILGHLCACGHPATPPWHRSIRHPTRLTGRLPGPCRMPDCDCQHARPHHESVVIPAYDSTTGDRLGHVIEPGVGTDELVSCAVADLPTAGRGGRGRPVRGEVVKTRDGLAVVWWRGGET